MKERLRNIVEKLSIPKGKVRFINHHEGHAAYAYYASPLRDNVLVLTVDSWGDGARPLLLPADLDVILDEAIKANLPRVELANKE